MGLTELEKITLNMGPVDLGQIDLLVREGFYQNRTDFIRTAIRNQLNTHSEAVKQTVVRKELVLGLQHYARGDLEASRAAGETLEIKVLGLASIADDVSPELALETIASLEVLGAFRARDDSLRRPPSFNAPSEAFLPQRRRKTRAGPKGRSRRLIGPRRA